MDIESPLPSNSLKSVIGVFAKAISSYISTIGVYKVVGICGIGSNGCVFTVQNQDNKQIHAMKFINLSYYLINRFSLDPVLFHESAYTRFKEISDDILTSAYLVKCFPKKVQTCFSCNAEKNSFLREFNALKCLPANINTVFMEDYGYIEIKSSGKNEYNYSVPYIVMPFLEGEVLSTRIEQEMIPSERLIRTFSWVKEILQIINNIHAEGVIHRDLYSNNFLINEINSKIFLVDFGSAITKGNLLTDTPGERRGARRFMPPEQFRDPSSVDFRSDYFFVGALIFYSLSLKTPFDRTRNENTLPVRFNTVYTRPSCISHITYNAICNYIEKLLEFYPINRFQTLKDMQNMCDVINSLLEKDFNNV